MTPIVLATSSTARIAMFRAAGIPVAAEAARVDEESITAALRAEGARARDVADVLATAKAERLSNRYPGALVIGADQVLECEGEIFGKARDRADAAGQLGRLAGRTHRLFSAAVAVRDGEALWRHVGVARLTMHMLTPEEIAAYLDRCWETARESVGVYRIEAEGVRLFSRVEGDHFTICGLPLIELLTWLRLRGDIAP